MCIPRFDSRVPGRASRDARLIDDHIDLLIAINQRNVMIKPRHKPGVDLTVYKNHNPLAAAVKDFQLTGADSHARGAVH